MSRNVGREHGQLTFVVTAVRAGPLEFCGLLRRGEHKGPVNKA